MLKYSELVVNFPKIPEIQNREFAFLFWDKNYMIRHRGFVTPDQLYSELRNVTPKHVYHSAALYKDPSNKIMSEKEWLGCDFVVDIDADHMDLSCQKNHDYFICMNCDYVSQGKITKCPKCEGPIRKQFWLCEVCLNASKLEVVKLVDDFLPDFGYTRDDIEINFSGHRGYHIHLRDEFIRAMNSNERRQIVDYITGTNFEPIDFFSYDVNNGYFKGSTIDDPGWKGRIARSFLKILNDHEDIESFDEDFGHIKVDAKIKNGLFDRIKREKIIEQLRKKNPNWIIKDFAKGSWEKVKNFLLSVSMCDVDVPVSIDTHRLIRIQGSLHGKTGFIVKPLDYYEMVDFKPLSDPIVFSLETQSIMKVEITTPICPEIRIQGEQYGPFKVKGEIVEVPEAVAIFLTCKDVAKIVK